METIELRNIKKPGYTLTESLRTLKTNIQFCGDDIKTILLTSSIPNEGKSTVSFELARSLTESGKKVLLIDTDMRKSVLIGRLGAALQEKGEIYGYPITSPDRRNYQMCCMQHRFLNCS